MLEETKRKVEKSRDDAFDQVEELRAALDKSEKTKRRYQAEASLLHCRSALILFSSNFCDGSNDYTVW